MNKNVKITQKNNGKVVVITGASSGIGKRLLNSFVNFGYIVIAVNRTNPDNYQNFIMCDLSDEQSIVDATQIILQKYDKIDILINNAGLGISGAQELLPFDEIRRVVEVDYFAALQITRLLLPSMTEKSKIVNISSACALFALPYRAVYCSAKAALSMFSYGLRMELSKSGISVVTVCPGDIKTNFTANRLKFSDSNSRYGDDITKAAAKVDNRENKRMDEVKASAKIFKIAANKNKALYIIGGKYKFLYFMQKILPTNLFLKLTNKMFNK